MEKTERKKTEHRDDHEKASSLHSPYHIKDISCAE